MSHPVPLRRRAVRRRDGPPPADMPQEAVVYIVNLIIGVILAGLLSQHWRLAAVGDSLRYWIVAAWTLAAADLFFVLRSGMEHPVARALPTLMVTAGHVTLWLAAQRTAGRPATTRLAIGAVVVHGALLIAFLAFPAVTSWRTVANGLVWGVLSVAAAASLWSAPERLRRAMRLPSLVLVGQGVFHAVRSLLATRAVVQPGTGTGALVQLLGDLEVSLFMVSLFVSVLVAYLRESNADLRLALEDVQQLSGLLPLCSWCNKVRDDAGYWTRIEQYLAAHRVRVTHCMCEACAAKHFGALEAPPAP